jgi:circadian clock protein KaiB
MQRSNGGPPEREQGEPDEKASETLAQFEKLVSNLSKPTYLFRLYVAGNSYRSTQAITSIRNICEKYLSGHYELEVVDVYQQPEATKESEVIALPTLIKELPLPPKRFVGDMSNTERILIGLKLGK